MKPPRLTIRRLMVAVAIVGVLLGLKVWMERRAEHFRLIATGHLEEWIRIGLDDSARDERRAPWHWKRAGHRRFAP